MKPRYCNGPQNTRVTGAIKSEVMPLTINKRQVIGYCQQYLAHWQGIPAERIQVTRLNGGLSNHLWLAQMMTSDQVTATEAETETETESSPVILRIYGARTVHFIDRDRELAIMQARHQQGEGPAVLAQFEGGRIESALPASPITIAQMRQPKRYRAIAQALQKFHRTPIPPQYGHTNLWDTLDGWLNQLANLPTRSSNQAHFRHEHLKQNPQTQPVIGPESVETLHKLLTKQKQRCLNHASEEVLSHNDLVAGNILLNKDQANDAHCYLIDVEYSTRGPRGFDLANFFRDCQGYGHPLFPELTPHEKLSFAEAYISASQTPNHAQAHAAAGAQIGSAAAKHLAKEAELYDPITDIFWGVWCALQAYEAANNDRDKALTAVFDYGAYGNYRLEYLANR